MAKGCYVRRFPFWNADRLASRHVLTGVAAVVLLSGYFLRKRRASAFKAQYPVQPVVNNTGYDGQPIPMMPQQNYQQEQQAPACESTSHCHLCCILDCHSKIQRTDLLFSLLATPLRSRHTSDNNYRNDAGGYSAQGYNMGEVNAQQQAYAPPSFPPPTDASPYYPPPSSPPPAHNGEGSTHYAPPPGPPPAVYDPSNVNKV